MITVRPISRALVPCDSAAAEALSSPNYDEFQANKEVWQFIQDHPASILAVKMPHCDVPSLTEALEEGSAAALQQATEKMKKLRQRSNMRVVENLLYVYEITAGDTPERPQIGLGCFAKSSEILTEKTPQGVIIRNEGILEKKAVGRADLIRATDTFIGVVNNSVEDSSGRILQALRQHVAANKTDFEVRDERGNLHRIWLITKLELQSEFIRLFAEEPYAYVADGNHRSAAAARLRYESFLTVFFPASTMGIKPYNRLVKAPALSTAQLKELLNSSFIVKELGIELGTVGLFQPKETHHIGVYTAGQWLELEPRPGTYDPQNAVESIDSDIVQRQIFARLFDITDARDERLTFVGSNKDTAYLKQQVDTGNFQYALTLPPVTMAQFIEVCRQRRMMPPKSTWFEPKIRSGLVIALLD